MDFDARAMDFDSAFPRLSHHLTRCGGQLAVQCGAHSCDESASLTFHSLAASPFAAAPIVIRVMGDFTLEATLRDLEACLAWMEVDAGPCELYLCTADSPFFDVHRIESAPGAPPCCGGIRGGVSPMVCLIREGAEVAEEEDVYILVEDIACTATYHHYDWKASCPRLHHLIIAGSEPSSSASPPPWQADRWWVPPPALTTPPSTPRRRSRVAPRTRGFSLGTAYTPIGWACAELVDDGAPLPSDIRTMTVTLASVTAGLAKLELLLPPAPREGETHAALCQWLARSAHGHMPTATQGLTDVFPAHRFPPEARRGGGSAFGAAAQAEARSDADRDAQLPRLSPALTSLREDMERRLGLRNPFAV